MWLLPSVSFPFWAGGKLEELLVKWQREIERYIFKRQNKNYHFGFQFMLWGMSASHRVALAAPAPFNIMQLVWPNLASGAPKSEQLRASHRFFCNTSVNQQCLWEKAWIVSLFGRVQSCPVSRGIWIRQDDSKEEKRHWTLVRSVIKATWPIPPLFLPGVKRSLPTPSGSSKLGIT